MANEDIKKALAELDSSNDAHWTDDGLPRVDVIQVLLKDPTIKRKDVSEASPGFSRAATEAVTEPEDVQPGDPTEAVAATPPPADADLEHDDGLNLDPKDPLSDVARLDKSDLREAMLNRITAAEARWDAAKQATYEAAEYEKKCMAWADKAKLDFNRVFPPLHPSDAIKAHLQNQLEQRYIAAGQLPPTPGNMNPALSPLEVSLMGRKRAGRVYRQPAVTAH